MSDSLLSIQDQPERFAGNGNLKTIAAGILKHKIVGPLRKRGSERPIEPQEDYTLETAFDHLLQADGQWDCPPCRRGEPETVPGQAQFLAALEACLGGLPPRSARIFMPRGWLENETAETCDEMQIGANPCGVMLCRARITPTQPGRLGVTAAAVPRIAQAGRITATRRHSRKVQATRPVHQPVTDGVTRAFRSAQAVRIQGQEAGPILVR